MFPPGPFSPVSSENRNGTIDDEDDDDDDDDDDEGEDDDNDDDEGDEGGEITSDVPASSSYDSSSFSSMRHHV